MPGILGLCNVDDPSAIDGMSAAMAHLPWHARSRELVSGDVVGACVALHAPLTTARVVEHAGVVAWIHGELYGTSDAGLAALLFASDAAARLARVNGNFAVAAWHRATRRLRLATDRLGLRHLYWARLERGIVWASEAKGVAAASSKLRHVRVEAAHELVTGGHLRGEGTWFRGVELVPAATLLSFDVASGQTTQERYWSWPESPTSADLAPITRRLAERWREVHEEYAALPGAPVITLSGGLDSRAILAAFTAAGKAPHLVTFGRPHSLDVQLATTIAKQMRLPHDVCELAADNWQVDRDLATWITDGQFDFRHMHVVRCLRRCVEVGDVVLNGFLGDAFLGGGYLSRAWTSEQRYRERGRRFISEGTRMSESFLLHRLPFCDNEIVELSLAVPEKLRRGGAFYQRFLRDTYPALFASIGHTPHGAPPCANPVRRAASAAWYWARDRYDYHAYRAWVAAMPALEPSRSRFSSVVDDAVWAGPIARWRSGRLGARDCDIVMRLVGIERWMEHVAARLDRLAVSRPRRDVA